MLDGLLWKVSHVKTTYRSDGALRWLVLERHRITGQTRSYPADHPEIRAQDHAHPKRGKNGE